ncbi:MAG: hypothetical protein ACI81R_002490 [Bradymonadia bacterium]|jgi:hypothetical protein
MPAKGIFTQCLVVLFDEAPTLDALTAALSPLGDTAAMPAGHHWSMGGEGLSIAMTHSTVGRIGTDIVPAPWPDDMGDPKESPIVFGAWSFGNFGPGVFPGSLARTIPQSWQFEDAEQVAAEHQAFVRVRTTYVMGGGEDDPVLPEGYDAAAELQDAVRVAQAVLTLPGARCLFLPAAETLNDGQGVADLVAHAAEVDAPPFELLVGVRLLQLAEHEPWTLMDTVGLGQLDQGDHEAIFKKEYDPSTVAGFLLNISQYAFENVDVIADGDTVKGPGAVDWRAHKRESLYLPPRPVLRWVPLDGTKVPVALIDPV